MKCDDGAGVGSDIHTEVTIYPGETDIKYVVMDDSMPDVGRLLQSVKALLQQQNICSRIRVGRVGKAWGLLHVDLGVNDSMEVGTVDVDSPESQLLVSCYGTNHPDASHPGHRSKGALEVSPLPLGKDLATNLPFHLTTSPLGPNFLSYTHLQAMGFLPCFLGMTCQVPSLTSFMISSC